MYIYTAIIVFNVTMHCYQYHIIQKSNRLQIRRKQLVCLSKCFGTSSLRSLNMKCSCPLQIEKKVMQLLSACLVWCTLLTEESAFHELFCGVDNFSHKHLFFLLTDSLIFTIFSIFCSPFTCVYLAGLSQESQGARAVCPRLHHFDMDMVIKFNRCDFLMVSWSFTAVVAGRAS